jgi:inosine/xanthosine triphosphate pyrophosphatase family protein
MKKQINEIERMQQLAGLIKEEFAKLIKEEEETLDPEVQQLVNKLIPQIDESKKTEMNEAFADYSELIMQVLAGAYGTAAAVYFGSLIALAFKKGGKEEFQKAMKELEKAHRGGSFGGN